MTTFVGKTKTLAHRGLFCLIQKRKRAKKLDVGGKGTRGTYFRFTILRDTNFMAGNKLPLTCAFSGLLYTRSKHEFIDVLRVEGRGSSERQQEQWKRLILQG